MKQGMGGVEDQDMAQVCRGVADALSRRLDGECGPAEAARVDAHLESCAACRRDRDALVRVDRLARRAVAANPFGAALAARIKASLPPAPPRREAGAPASPSAAKVIRLSDFRRWAPAAAAAAVLVAGIVAWRLAGPDTDTAGISTPAAVARLGEATGGPGVEVKVRRDGFATSAARGVPIEVRAGDRVDVAGAGTAEIRLDDGSRVTVAGGTGLLLGREAPGSVTVALSTADARIFADVTPRIAGRTFRVESPVATVEVIGTRFGVETHAGREMVVAVVEGRVRCGLAGGGAPALVGAGEIAHLAPATANRPAVRVAPADVRAAVAWAIALEPAAGAAAPAPGAGSRPDPGAPRPGARPAPPPSSGEGDLPVAPPAGPGDAPPPGE